MGSPFHSLADFELTNMPAPPRKSEPEAPAPPKSAPSGKRSTRFVPLEDRVTRAVKSALPSVHIKAESCRIRKEKTEEGWQVDVEPNEAARAAAKLGDASLRFTWIGSGAEDMSLEIYLVKPTTRVRMGKANGPATQEGMNEMALKALKYVTAGFVR
jgi:hypothetical protein